MRSAKANDYWKKINSIEFINFVNSLEIEDCNGFSGNIIFEPGITAICGLNGVGKSSLISAIVNLLGISDNSVIRKSKFHGTIEANLVIEKSNIHISEASTAISKGLDRELIQYIDSDLAIDCIKYWEQENIDELIEAEEGYAFKEKELDAVNQLIGKKYSECIAYTIEDSGQSFTPMYFMVKIGNEAYGSQEMGIGEHFLLYLYNLLIQVKEGTILIIEEPESYISIHSQKIVLNYIAEIIVKKKISVILTTHSPFILSQVEPKNIRIITNRFGKMQIQIPNSTEVADKLLGKEYKIFEKIVNNGDKIATIFVEDYAARLFLSTILRNNDLELYNKVDIVSLDGESDITTFLKYDIEKYMSHKIIGVYDGDMLSKISSEKIDKKAKLPYCFLPIAECVEIEIKNYVEDERKSIELQNKLNIETSLFYAIIESLDYKDHHDWFIEFCKETGKTQEEMIDLFYCVWIQHNEKTTNDFIEDIRGKVLKEEKEGCVPVIV